MRPFQQICVEDPQSSSILQADYPQQQALLLHQSTKAPKMVLCIGTMQQVPLHPSICRITAFPTSPGCGERKPCNAPKKFLVALKKIMQVFRQMLTSLKPEEQTALSHAEQEETALFPAPQTKRPSQDKAELHGQCGRSLQCHFHPACTATSVAVTYMKCGTAKKEYIYSTEVGCDHPGLGKRKATK